MMGPHGKEKNHKRKQKLLSRKRTLKTIEEEAADKVREKNARREALKTKVDEDVEDEVYYDARDRAIEEGRTKDNHIEKEDTQSRTKADEEKKQDRISKK